MTSTPRILVLDIETSPALAWTFSLFKTTIGIHQIEVPTRVMSWAAMWHGDDGPVDFGAEWQRGGKAWVKRLHKMMMEADAVAHWNGDSFDLPHLNKLFREHGLDYLPPIASIDVMKHFRRQYRYMSNKLDWIAQELLQDRKETHSGFQLWLDVLRGNAEARAKMESYNKHDVELTDQILKEVYAELRTFPDANLYAEGGDGCPRCGSLNVQRRGHSYTKIGKYPRFWCKDCKGWSKSAKSEGLAVLRGIA